MKLQDIVIVESAEVKKLRVQLNKLEEKLNSLAPSITEALSLPSYGADTAPDLLQRMFEETLKRMEAAKRGLGLANKLTGPTKKKHLSRIMGNMNRIRSAIRKMEKLMQHQAEDTIE